MKTLSEVETSSVESLSLVKSKYGSIDIVKFMVVERTVTELSHMDAGEQVEVAETTLGIAVVK